LRAWRARRRQSTGCGSARGSCCWRRAAWRAGRLGARSAARPARPRSGVYAMPKGGLQVLMRRVSAGLSRSTRRKPTNASWRCWTNPQLRVMRAGRELCWRPRSAMSMSSMSGASCAPRRSTWPDANPGARATIPRSSQRLPMWSGSIWRRPRTRSSSASTRSLRSRPWSGRRAI